ncbi:MAG: copper resistance protein, partial [Bosea sp. 12-68-7]
MIKLASLKLAGLALALSAGAALAGPGAAGHHDGEVAYGKPGDPKKPARLVQISMGERDGKMQFIPDRIEIRRGEQVKFQLRNNGELDHELVLATLEE